MLVSHGTPVLTQEVITDSELLRFVGALSRLRRKQAALLLPADFDELRSITWHGASAGKHTEMFASPTCRAGLNCSHVCPSVCICSLLHRALFCSHHAARNIAPAHATATTPQCPTLEPVQALLLTGAVKLPQMATQEPTLWG